MNSSLDTDQGRIPWLFLGGNIPGESRVCVCRTGVQIVWRLFVECPREMIGLQIYRTLADVFSDADDHQKLLMIDI